MVKNSFDYEKKWQKFWEEKKIFETPKNPKDKFYILEMFAYPSGDLHIGHLRNYVLVDVIARYMRMKGKDVLHPVGWDAFGLPAEEAAIKRGIAPDEWTYKNISVSENTLKMMGISYDWNRRVVTCSPDYYKWTQWIFILMYKRGLAYRKKSFVNWCPSCQTVLANEQVEDGKCWRCKSEVVKKEMEQWFFKITDYAERLLNDLSKIEKTWPSDVVAMQRNWIGKSEGVEIEFGIEGSDEKCTVFTTRPDTIFGVTFAAIAPEHPLIEKLWDMVEDKEKVKEYIDKSLKMSEIDRVSTVREKDGVFSGIYLIHPFTKERVPLYVANYVLVHYGTGVVMGVPAHDTRDFAFAKKYNIPIKVVIKPENADIDANTMDDAYTEEGIMINSDKYNGMKSSEFIKVISDEIEKNGYGRKTVKYRLRDWLISRQRYWGAPIPMIHCPKCGVVPVKEEDLPVLLPPSDKVDYTPKGKSPLSSVDEFVNTTCPKCGGPAKRDPDTMDTFVDSSWYQIRYTDPHNDKEIFNKNEANKWMPVDLYIGGKEHATGHLIYFRFITKVLHDAGLLDYDEPAVKLFNQGMIADEKGETMSKSKGNAVPVGPFVEENGADVARLTIMFIGPPEKDAMWTKQGITGIKRFLDRFMRAMDDYDKNVNKDVDPSSLKNEDLELYKKTQQTIKGVTEDIENFGMNTAIAKMMELLNVYYSLKDKVSQEVKNNTLFALNILISPFASHIAEEFYHTKMGYDESKSIFDEKWVVYNKDYVLDDKITVVVQVNGKLRARMSVARGTDKKILEDMALKDEDVKKWIEGKEIKKIIVVPDKLVSIVAK